MEKKGTEIMLEHGDRMHCRSLNGSIQALRYKNLLGAAGTELACQGTIGFCLPEHDFVDPGPILACASPMRHL